MRARRAVPHLLGLAALVATAVACGDGGSSASDDAAPAAESVTTVATTTTPAPTTTIAPTTTSTTSTTSTPAPTTTAVPTTVGPPGPLPEPAMNIGSAGSGGSIGTIEIPKIGVTKQLFDGVTDATLNKGPGHWPGTALPGQFGNVVVGGHRTARDRPFRHIDQLAPGDEVIFTTADGRFVYHVSSTEIVGPNAIWIIDQTPAYTATLFSCHPVGSTRERIVIHLELQQ
jgi:sortase A